MANEGQNALKQEIARIKQNIADSYDACAEKNATMPSIQNSNNLAETIRSIVLKSSDITTVVGEFAKYNIKIELIADDVYALIVNDYNGEQQKNNYYMGDITGDVVEGITSLYITDI